MRLLALLALACAPAAAEPTPVAGSVVRSKEWVIRRGAQKEEEFVGDVRYESGGTRMTSDWALFKHADKTWQARGSVYLRRETPDGAVFEARGRKAWHDEVAKRGYLEPAPGQRVTFSRTPPALEADFGEAGRVAWSGDSRVMLSAGAKVWGPRIELGADEAVYEKTSGLLTLNGGRPVLRKVEGEWTTALKADTIAATEEPKRIQASGRVTGWLVFKNPETLKDLAK